MEGDAIICRRPASFHRHTYIHSGPCQTRAGGVKCVNGQPLLGEFRPKDRVSYFRIIDPFSLVGPYTNEPDVEITFAWRCGVETLAQSKKPNPAVRAHISLRDRDHTRDSFTITSLPFSTAYSASCSN
jgi:hypothetical protein